MTADPSHRPITRRTFLGGAVVVAATPLWASSGCPAASADPLRPTSIDGWPIPPVTKLSAARYATLVAAMDAIFPDTDGSPGATQANAAWYLDQLLGAFDVDPPRIFAGGPYSGRHGGLDNFSHFQRLTRVEELRWRTTIEGSQGIAAREFNGPVKGLVERYQQGLDALEAEAGAQLGVRLTQASADDRLLFLATGFSDADFARMLFEHAAEGTYGDPVYGGNQDLAGWLAIDFEGDRQPVGYNAEQVSEPRR